MASRAHTAQAEADLAVEFVAMHRARLPVLASAGSRDGESHVETAWRHLAAAVAIDPADSTARTWATHLLIARGERIPRGDESKALAALLARFPDDPDLQLVSGREARMRGDNALALRRLTRAAALGGPARGDILLDLAKAAQQVGDTARAIRAYFDGVRVPSVAGRLAYRMDLAWILPADSMAIFDAVPDAQLVPWLEKFWHERDAAALVPPGARLIEQLRRWSVVHREFMVDLPWRHDQFTRVEFLFEDLDPCIASNSALYELLSRQVPVHPDDIRDKEPILDHRGLIYLRHGEPIRRVTGHGHGFPEVLNSIGQSSKFERPRVTPTAQRLYDMDLSMAINEGWLYWFDGEYRVLNFRGSKALGFAAATTLTSYLPPADPAGSKFGEDWRLRASFTPTYAQAYAEMQAPGTPPTCRAAVIAAIKESRATAALSLQTDSDSPPLVAPWDAVIQISGLGMAQDGSGRALIAYAIPLTSLDRQPVADGGSRWSARVRAVAFNRVTGRRVELDTTAYATSRSATGGRGEYLTGLFPMRLDAGTWQVAVLGVDDSGANRAYVVDRSVPVAVGDGVGVSDLLLGRANGTPRWPERGEAVPINPLGTWPFGTPIEVYAEVYGIGAGQSFGVEFTAQPVDGDGERSIRVATRERSAGSRTALRRSFDISRLPPGRYRLGLRIDAGKASAQATRDVVVLKSSGKS